MDSPENLSIIVASGGGLLSFLSPCVLPLLPSYLSIITGMSYGDLEAQQHIEERVVLNSLIFIIGFSTVFIALGASLSLLGGFFASDRGIIQRIAGLIIIFFGLYIVGVFKIPFLLRPKDIIKLQNKPAGCVGSSLVGVSFGFAWMPCVGPILGAILALAGTAKGISNGMILLTAYSMGLAIPFFLASLATKTFLSILRKFGKFLHVAYLPGGILLIMVGILIFSGHYTRLNSLFIGLTPSWLWDRI